MNEKYAEILNLPHHTSKLHPRMSLSERAAQFAPFAAVSGYGASIDEASRITHPKYELDESEKASINERLKTLHGEITLTYFIKDKYKDGGVYVTGTHTVKKTDPSAQTVLFTDGLVIAFDDIYCFSD